MSKLIDGEAEFRKLFGLPPGPTSSPYLGDEIGQMKSIPYNHQPTQPTVLKVESDNEWMKEMEKILEQSKKKDPYQIDGDLEEKSKYRRGPEPSADEKYSAWVKELRERTKNEMLDKLEKIVSELTNDWGKGLTRDKIEERFYNKYFKN